MYKIDDTFSFKIDKSNYGVYIFIYNTVILTMLLYNERYRVNSLYHNNITKEITV